MSPIDEPPKPGPADHPKIPAPVAAPSPPAITYDEIERIDRIGAGGDADVYRATVTADGSEYTIAVKEPRFQGTIQAEIIERFNEEAQTWATLSDHDNIVAVYEWGSTPLPWIALEYMDGGELTQKLGTIAVDEALWLAGRLAEGVRHGHRHGIAHLDLKPANVLFRETGSETWPFPKLSDWGLAKLLLEHSSSVEGVTPQYGAPEQFDPDSFGPPDDYTDIYQLGAILYALLTGTPPFTGPARTVMHDVLNTEPDPPSVVGEDIPPAVDDVVLRALAKDKTDRYATVVDLRRELDRLFVAQTEAGDGAEAPAMAGAVSTDASGDSSSEAIESRSATDGDTSASSAQPTDQEPASESESALLTRRQAVTVLGLGAIGLAGGIVASPIGDGGGGSRSDGGGQNRAGGGGGTPAESTTTRRTTTLSTTPTDTQPSESTTAQPTTESTAESPTETQTTTSTTTTTTVSTTETTTTTTATPTGDVVYRDRFEDGVYTDRWTVVEGHQTDQASVTEQNGQLVHTVEGTPSGSGGNLRTLKTLAPSGMIDLQTRMQSTTSESREFGLAISFIENSDIIGGVVVSENSSRSPGKETGFNLVRYGSQSVKKKINLNGTFTSSAWKTYALKIDLDARETVRATRGDETYDVSVDLQPVYADQFWVIIGTGKDHEVAYDYVEIVTV